MNSKPWHIAGTVVVLGRSLSAFLVLFRSTFQLGCGTSVRTVSRARSRQDFKLIPTPFRFEDRFYYLNQCFIVF